MNYKIEKMVSENVHTLAVYLKYKLTVAQREKRKKHLKQLKTK